MAEFDLLATEGPVDGLDAKGRKALLRNLVVEQKESVRIAREGQAWVDAVAAEVSDVRSRVAAEQHRRVTVAAAEARLAAYERDLAEHQK